jgi:hypothetical protein
MIDRETGLLALARKKQSAIASAGAALAAAQRAVIDPVDHQLSLSEVPVAIHLHELVQISN